MVSLSWDGFISPRPLKRPIVDVLLALEGGGQQALAVGLVAGVGDGAAMAQAIERRLGQIEMAALDQLGQLAEEEGHQQRGDVGAVDIGVGHDDDLVVAQIVRAPVLAGAAAEGGDQVGQLLVAGELVGGGRGDVEDLAAQRQHRLGLAVARLLGRAAGRIALDDEDLGALARVAGAVGELAGQAQLAGRGLAADLLACAFVRAIRSSARLRQMLEHGGRRGGMAAEPELEPVLDRVLDQPGRLGRDQPLLGLALELRLAHEQRQQQAGAAGGVLGGDRGGAPEADPLGMGAQALQQRRAQAGLVRAAERRRHGVAVPAGVGLLVDRPGDRPLDPAALLQRRLAGERLVDHELAAVEQRLEEVGEALREVEALLGRHRAVDRQQGRIAAPADLDAAEQIGLAARHPVQRGRAEARVGAEDLGVGDEADRGAAPVGRGTGRRRAAPGAGRARSAGGRARGCARPRPPARRQAR